VFHVSQLKEVVGSTTQVTPSVPSALDILRVPEQFLQRRLVEHDHRPVNQVLVRWSGLPSSLAT
jgi:hypothetical protein